jgi:HEAT repeat protein
MMLAHSGSYMKTGSRARAGGSKTRDGLVISWGLSPVSRVPVDGFLKMPFLSDQREWVQFVDWRGNGHISAEDLAGVVAAMLPIEEKDSIAFVNQRFRLSDGSLVSEAELVQSVIPFLESQCSELSVGARKPLHEPSPFMNAVAGLRFLIGSQDMYILRCLCRRFRSIAEVILVHDLGNLFAKTIKQPGAQRRLCLSPVATSIGYIAQKSSTRAIYLFVSLLDDTDDVLRLAGIEHLPRFADADDPLLLAELSTRLRHSSERMRLAVIQVLSRIASPGQERILQLLLSKISDREPAVCIAAMHVVGDLAERGDEAVIRSVVNRMQQGNDMAVMAAAEDALQRIAKGHAPTVELFCNQTMDGDEESCLQALRVLSQIADIGDARVIQTGLDLLKRPVSEVGDAKILGSSCQVPLRTTSRAKSVAIGTLSNIAEKGDQRVLKKVSASLYDADPQVIEAAIRLLGNTAKCHDKHIVKLMISVWSDRYTARYQGPHYRLQTLRLISLDMLEKLGEGGDEGICEFLLTLFGSKVLEVRMKAVSSVGVVAKRGDCRAIRALDELQQKEVNGQVKLAATNSLDAIGDPVYESTLKVCYQMCICISLSFGGAAAAGGCIMLIVHVMRMLGVSFPTAVFLCFVLMAIIACLIKKRKWVYSCVNENVCCCCPNNALNSISAPRGY